MGDCSQDALLEHSLAAFAEIERIERTMSFHDPRSELSRLNREASRRPVRVSREMVEVLSYALRLSRLTDGAFDFTVAASELIRLGVLPAHGPAADSLATWRDLRLDGDQVRFEKPLLIDLGGIAKGYAVDRAMSVLPASLEASVNAGGDLRQRPWRGRTVGIRVPGSLHRDSVVELPMCLGAVATSGSYFGEEGSIVVCPKRRRLVADRRSFSVFAPTCMQADALTKVAHLAPGSDPLWRQLNVAVLMVDETARCWWLGDA